MSEFLTKEAILNSKDSKIEIEEIPEWNGKVGVKTMSGEERDKFEQESIRRRGGKATSAANVDIKGLKCFLLSLTLCDKEGNRLFQEAEIKDLNKKNGDVIDRLFYTSQRINKLDSKSLKDAEKNLEKTPSKASGFNLPENGVALQVKQKEE